MEGEGEVLEVLANHWEELGRVDSEDDVVPDTVVEMWLTSYV